MRSSDIKQKRSLGQNFLINQGILDKIVQAAEVGPEDTVVEVGPGTGNLTRKLSEKAKQIIAIEKDHRLIDKLKSEFGNSNVEILEGDVLKFKIENLKLRDFEYKIVANIPYYITSNFLRTLLEEWSRPKLVVLTIQKEVAQRIVAKPPRMSLLALSVQLYAEPKIISYVSKGSFRPIPKVDSAIIKLVPKDDADGKNNERILAIAKKAFAGKRKQLKNTIGKEILEKVGIRPESRPEELSLDDWLKLARFYGLSK